jgi:hypothetical protein
MYSLNTFFVNEIFFEFRVTLKQQLILLTHLAVVTVGVIIGSVYFLKINIEDNAFIIGFTFYFFINILPTIIVHTQYWLKNHKAIFTVNTQNKELSYELPEKELKYSFADITCLEYYWNFGKGSGWHSFGEYRYYKIIFKDKTEIVITCLMINDIENTLEMLLRMKAEKHGKVLCLIE